jgi:tRNA nucleotidyltransferase (CCA-adding enzyme)
VSKVGLGEIERLFALRLADGTAMTGNPADPRSLEPFRERIEAVLAADHAFGLRDLAVGGEDLASAGIPRGPNMGKILAELLETVLDDPGLNTKERLIEIARRLKSKYEIA